MRRLARQATLRVAHRRRRSQDARIALGALTLDPPYLIVKPFATEEDFYREANRMVGKDFEIGLANLKTVAEGQAAGR